MAKRIDIGRGFAAVINHPNPGPAVFELAQGIIDADGQPSPCALYIPSPGPLIQTIRISAADLAHPEKYQKYFDENPRRCAAIQVGVPRDLKNGSSYGVVLGAGEVVAFGDAFTIKETAATPTQWLKLKHLDWATYQRLGQPGTPNWSGKLITVQQMEGVLKSVQGKAARQMIADQPLKKILADNATSRQAKVLASEMAEMAKVKEARKCKPDALAPAADNDNGEIMSSGEAAVELGITTQTLRRWIDVGRPIVGRKRKRKGELRVKTIGGRYVFEAASVRALAKQLAGWS